MKTNLSVTIGAMKLKNPVMVASGTFGYAEEFGDFMDLARLGAVVTKTITLAPRQGNPMPRTCETPSGMLNSIGLENPGVEGFIAKKLPFLKKLGVPIIVSVASESDPKEFIALAQRLNAIKEISAIELNISCPNIKVTRPQGHKVARLIAQDAKATGELVRMLRPLTRKTLIVKLSPNVTDIAEIALAAERAGADAVALINTLTGMSIDPANRCPKIAMGVAGLSGPAIRPVAVRMVWEASKKIRIPIIGMGGIIATAVSVGTQNFVNPRAAVEIIDGLEAYLRKNKIAGMEKIIGSLQV
jgi:dihydroorotate dehydrogenase (NAD+) catalytic subunit